MVSEMGGKWPYCSCFVGCCFQNFFKTACGILLFLQVGKIKLRKILVDFAVSADDADLLEIYVWHYTLLSSSSHNPAYVPGPTFGFVKLLASSGSHCTKWAHEQHRPAGFESRFVPDLPLPFIPTLIGLRAFDLVSSRVWWEAATNRKSE